MRRFSFHKGHGTKNDFIILDDSYGMHDMHPQFVQVVCDRVNSNSDRNCTK